MKKFLIMGLVLVAMFLLAEKYYRSRDFGPKAEVATSQKVVGENKTKSVKSVTLSVSVEPSFSSK